MTIVEPKETNQVLRIMNHGFKTTKSPFLPTKTVQIDLTKTKRTLLKEMHYKTRYNIRKHSDDKVQITNDKDINAFAGFWQECAKEQRGMFLSQEKEIREISAAFKNSSDLLLAYHKKRLLGGVLVLHASDVSYYMYAASNREGKKRYVPTMLAWEAIMKSKKRGSKTFDFEGIYDNRFPLKTWKGFSRFKKSFGGKEVKYPGAFRKIRLPIRS